VFLQERLTGVQQPFFDGTKSTYLPYCNVRASLERIGMFVLMRIVGFKVQELFYENKRMDENLMYS
jgi:hypothetical protein